MFRRLFVFAIGILALEARLVAGSILDVAFYPPSGVSCNSTLTSGTGSETLTLGACMGNGPVTFDGQPYVTATASPLKVSIDGLAALETGTFDSAMAIGASAQYSGSLDAVGGAGSAFLEFDVEAFGADVFDGDFAMASAGINYPVGSFMQQRQFIVPITFGETVGYSLSVSHSYYTWGEADVMMAGLSIDDLEVVDANGAQIAGATVLEGDADAVFSVGAAHASAVPEPGSASLVLIGAGLLVLGSWLKRWSRERGSNS